MHAPTVPARGGGASSPRARHSPGVNGGVRADRGRAPEVDRVVARVDAELAVDAPRVGLDGVERDVQRVADLALRELARQQPQDAELAFGELDGARRAGRRRAPAATRDAAAARSARASRRRIPGAAQRSTTPAGLAATRLDRGGRVAAQPARRRPARAARRRSPRWRRRARRPRRRGRSRPPRSAIRPRCSSARPWTTRASAVAQCSPRPRSSASASAASAIAPAASTSPRSARIAASAARGVDDGEVVAGAPAPCRPPSRARPPPRRARPLQNSAMPSTGQPTGRHGVVAALDRAPAGRDGARRRRRPCSGGSPAGSRRRTRARRPVGARTARRPRSTRRPRRAGRCSPRSTPWSGTGSPRPGRRRRRARRASRRRSRSARAGGTRTSAR